MYSVCVHSVVLRLVLFLFFFFNDTATTEIYTLSLHDALPIWFKRERGSSTIRNVGVRRQSSGSSWTESFGDDDYEKGAEMRDRKSTRLNSSHLVISYAVFCLKKKKK